MAARLRLRLGGVEAAGHDDDDVGLGGGDLVPLDYARALAGLGPEGVDPARGRDHLRHPVAAA